MGVRTNILRFFFLALFGFLGFHLYQIQITKHDYYFQKVFARENGIQKLEIQRGKISITDRYQNTIPVAINKEYPIIYADPAEIKNPEATANILSPILNIETSTLLKYFSNPKILFRILVEKPSSNLLDAVSKLNLDGIYEDTKVYREYPYGSLAAQTIGFVGLNKDIPTPQGIYGIEKYYNKELANEKDIQLTIDRNLQVKSEELIKNLVAEQNAESGLVIIQNPKTGAILTLANYPTFDLNEYSSSSIDLFSNPAVEATYEPGSVFKPITMAIGIENNIFTPTSTYNDKGYVILNGHKITNWNQKAYGPNTTMTNVIENSINTGAVWAQQQIGRKLFYDGVKNFGFGDLTQIDLPNEVKGNLKNLEKKDAQDIDYATAAFGQGIAVTPIQMINAYSAIANGGLLLRPYLNADLKPYIFKRVISEDTAKKVIQMMKSAVDQNKIAAIPQFQIAGKTGTAQIPDLIHGGYEDQYIHTFIGILPASRPEYVILVKLVKPKSALAGLSVVPAFKQLASFVLNYENVAPDNIPTNNTQTPK